MVVDDQECGHGCMLAFRGSPTYRVIPRFAGHYRPGAPAWHHGSVIRTAAPNGPPSQLSPRRWLAEPRAPVVVLAGSIVIGLLAELSLARAEPSMDAILVDAASGFAFVVAGLVAWRRRPDNRVGPIMIGIGLTWFGGDFLFSPVPLVGPTSLVAQAGARVLYAWLLLSFPSGRLDSATDRAAVVGIGAIALVLAILQLVTFETAQLCDCPANPFAIAAGTPLADVVGEVSSAVGVVMTIVLVPLAVRRVAVATGPARPALVPVLVGGIFSLLSVTPQLISNLGGPRVDPVSWLPIVYIALPVGFLVALLNRRIARGAVADLVVELGDSPAPEQLREALAAALHDPTLEVVRWSPERGAYVGADGAVIPAPTSRPGRAVTLLEGDQGHLAALVHDPALLDDPGLVASVAAAMRLAVENERLADEVRRQLDEVRASRTRIVEAADAERRRVERNLHDGAQQRLVALSLALRRARAQLPDDAGRVASATLDDAAEQLRLALAELRELARGIHPAILTEAGLGPAVRALARESPVPVTVDLNLPAELSGTIEAAVYFVVAEALTNVAKYADATRIQVIAGTVGGDLRVEIGDDGRGGADPAAGTGLRGLADRIAALGGAIEVRSPAGGGTRVIARIPLEGQGSGPTGATG
jgi:signal transduction histidine kinase